MSMQTNELDFDKVIISEVEIVHIYIKGEIEPIIIHRDNKAFNISIQITVSDVSDETDAPKPAGI